MRSAAGVHMLYMTHSTRQQNLMMQAQLLLPLFYSQPGRTIIWLIKNEGHRPPDNNEVSRALPFYALRSVGASQLPSFARYEQLVL